MAMNDLWTMGTLCPPLGDLAVIVLRVLFFVFAVLFAVNVLRQLRQQREKPDPFITPLAWGVVLVLVAMFVHQAYWQLAGFRHPEFVQFMSRYSRRVAGPADSMQRGRILDQNGLVLAETVDGKRVYPHGQTLSHVTGYSHTVYGKSGVERADDALLSGAAVKPTAMSLKRFGRNLLDHRLVSGVDSVLTLDARLQAVAAELMGRARGAVVGIDPRSGAIRLLYSAPSFDAANPTAAMCGDDAVMFNRALSGLYPPGSTYKVLVAAVATEHGMGGMLDCPADGVAAEAGARKIRDHEYYERERAGKRWGGHGSIDIRAALERSSNVYFAQMGMLLGAERLGEIGSRFGMGESLQIFTGTSGTIASKSSRIPQLSMADRRGMSQVAIGQGKVLVTPLHMATAIACLAHGGVGYHPYLKAGTPPLAMPRGVSEKTATLLGAYMERVVTHGTGRGCRIRGLRIAGKTGTAQTPSGDDHGWFVAFGPTKSPALALAVVVENSGYGSRRAVPIARELFLAAEAMGLLKPVVEEVRP
jgi:penicillin-binding protein A